MDKFYEFFLFFLYVILTIGFVGVVVVSKKIYLHITRMQSHANSAASCLSNAKVTSHEYQKPIWDSADLGKNLLLGSDISMLVVKNSEKSHTVKINPKNKSI